MIIQGLEFPDYPEHCQECVFVDELRNFGQSAICIRCPLFTCTPMDEEMGALIEPDGYRRDWLEEWYKFFQTGEYPQLRLIPEKGNV